MGLMLGHRSLPRRLNLVLSSKPIQRRRSLHEQTYQALRASILRGELAPGERLVETQLAQQLQVSRTPIREAIRQLQKEGLVTADASGGLCVTMLSTADAVQLYDCRMALEQLSVLGACDHATDAQLGRLEQSVAQAEAASQKPPSQDHFVELLALDYQFHRLIAESSGNQCLVSLLDQVFDKMALLRIQTTRHNPKVLEIRLEHRQIFETIARRDQAAAVQAIQAHLGSSRIRVSQAIEHLRQATDAGS